MDNMSGLALKVNMGLAQDADLGLVRLIANWSFQLQISSNLIRCFVLGSEAAFRVGDLTMRQEFV